MVLFRRFLESTARLVPVGAAIVGTCLAASPAQAQSPLSSSPFDQVTAGDPDARMLLEADQLVYDYDNERVSAVGNVEMYYKGYAVETAEVVYDQASQRVYASGGVKVTQPDGNVIYATQVELTDDFREGFLQELTLVTPERARFAAATAERRSDEITIFNRGVYTACEPCRENPDRAPIWQFKARRIIHNQEEKVVQYEDATFEAFGVPIAYFPYFSHPDPSVKRKSGFLQPEFHYADEVGFGVGVPYFFALAPNYDLTVQATGFSNQGLLSDVAWRHRLVNGAYTVRGAFIAQANPEDFAAYDRFGNQRAGFQSDGDWRGFVATEGLFDINEFWQWGFEGHLLSDAEFFDDYYVSNETEIRDQIFLTGLSARNYFDARIVNYQILYDYNDETPFRPDGRPDNRFDHPNAELPLVHPVVDYNYIFDRPILGGQLSFDSNFLSVTRHDPDFVNADADSGCPVPWLETEYSRLDRIDGADFAENCRLLGVPGSSTRFVAQAEWERSIVMQGGQILTPFASLRGDAYRIDVEDPFTVRDAQGDPIIGNFINTGEETILRGMVTAGVEARWPVLVSAGWGYQIFEPMAQFIARPDAQHNWTLQAGNMFPVPGEAYVPNEDAISFVFDDTSLFERDKFSGYDLMEGGTRLNAGLRYKLQANSGFSASGLIGQSYHLAGENPFPMGSGLGTDRSDYVGALYVSPIDTVEIGTRVRLDEDDFSLMRQDFQLRGTAGPVSGTGIYTEIAKDPDQGILHDRREVGLGASLALSEQWKLFGGARYEIEGPPADPDNPDDVGAPQWISQSIGVGWENECVAFAVQYQRTFVRDGNVEPDSALTFSLKLRTVTEAKFSTSIAESYLD